MLKLYLTFTASSEGQIENIFRKQNITVPCTERHGVQIQTSEQQKVTHGRYNLYVKFSNLRAYYELTRIVQQRQVYLRKMRANRREGRPVVFLDETWCNAHDGKLMNWVELDPVCKGGTIGGSAGFVSYHCIFTDINTFILQQAIWERRTSYHTTCRWQRWMDRRCLEAI